MTKTLITAALLASAALAETPAERKIESARQAVEQNASANSYTELAMALSQRARETSDPAYYKQGLDLLMKARVSEPRNLEVQRAEIWLLLGQHEFANALDKAKALNAKVPDDLQTYAFLVDANGELGKYDDAEKAADFLLNLRPGNIPSLTRAGYLRELFGDLDGAAEMMERAFQRTRPTETEELAWILSQISHLRLIAGKTDLAERAASDALELFPGYHYALGALGNVRQQQGRYAEAVTLLERRYQMAPHPRNLFDLAAALDQAGETVKARQAWALFETSARADMNGADNANHELVMYYVDVVHKANEALDVANLEHARRQDVYTLDAHAWALYAQGKAAAALVEIREAIAVGVKDPKILQHATLIQRAAELARK